MIYGQQRFQKYMNLSDNTLSMDENIFKHT